MKTKYIYYLMFFFSFMSCKEKTIDINVSYLNIYYEYSINQGQSLEARKGYINKLIQFTKHPKKHIKVKSFELLYKLYLNLKESKKANDLYLIVHVEDAIHKFNKDFKYKVINRVTLSSSAWIKNESLKQSKIARKITSSLDWDKRIYGTWIFQNLISIEQYRFYPDTSFELIKIYFRAGKENSTSEKQMGGLERSSTVERGIYRISKNQNQLKLFFKEDSIYTKELIYIIDSKRLNLSGREFFKKSNH